jgi:hypothetical protein
MCTHSPTPFSHRPVTGHSLLTRHRRPLGAVVTGLAALLVACASQPPPPNPQMAAAEAALESAARAGAAVSAPTEMALARDKLARANASMLETKYERAQMLAEAALVDARLAEAKARQVQATKAATTVQDESRVLRQEIERGAVQ